MKENHPEQKPLPNLSNAEWDFSKVPPEEIAACCAWEYARESSSIRAAVDEHQRFADQLQKAGGNIFLNAVTIPRTEEGVRSVEIMRSLFDLGHQALMTCAPRGSFPPWQDLRPNQKYPEHLFQCNPALVIQERRRDNVGNITQRDMRYVANIDWTRSPKQITEAFKAWLETARPPTQSKPKKGRPRNSINYRLSLKCLGIMRVLHTISFADPRFPKASLRFAEKRVYEMRIESQEKFHLLFPFLDKSELPLSWPTRHQIDQGNTKKE